MLTDDPCTACYTYPCTTPGTWICDRCADQLHSNLHAILGSPERPGLAHELDLELTGQARKTSGGRVTSPTPKLPVNLAASDCLTAIRHQLLTASILTHGDMPPIPNTIPDLAEWLLSHEDRFARRSGSGHITDTIHQLVGHARRIIDTPAERIYVGTCPCNTRLMATVGKPTVTCRGCGTTYDAADSRNALLESVADQWLTIDQIALLISKPRSTIWHWDNKERLTQHPTDPRRFRLGDALNCTTS